MNAKTLRGLETLCAALHAATETDPAVKDVAWKTFELIREHREQAAEVERLTERLRAAEAVCVMYGIQPAHLETEREKAAYEVWLMWAALVDPGATTSHPDLTNERIAELARQRDEKRAKALDGIQKLTREL